MQDASPPEPGFFATAEMLELAQEAGRIGLFEWNVPAGRVRLSHRFRLHYAMEAFDGSFEGFLACIFREDRPRVAHLINTAFAEVAREMQAEFRIAGAAGGALNWIETRFLTFYDAQRKPERVIGVNVDITERKQAIVELRRFTESLEEAVRERQRIEAALREESGTLEILNRTGAALAGQLELEKVVQRVTDAGRELTGAQFGAFFYNVLDHQGGRYMLYTLSGAERSDFERFGMPRATAIFAPTFDGEGIIRSADITQDPRYGREAPHHGMPKGHLPVRSYLAVPVASRSGEVIGGMFFGHPDPGVFSLRSEQVMTGLAAQAAIAIDNARLFQEVQLSNRTLEQRVDQRTEELQRAHEALRQAQKMEAIGQLTGGIAHDFNNLLTVIRGSADLLRRRELPEDKRQRYIEAISDTADRAARLVSQLLSFARRQALKPEVFDAATCIRDTTEMLGVVLGPRIQLSLETNCENCSIEADLAQFEAALVNLSVNARDAMDGEGKLTIEISTIGELPPGIDIPSEGPFISVSVADTGVGIAQDALERVFEPFFTTKEAGKGTGLGLSQVYGFVKQSGGDIRVESEVGRGTVFTLYLRKAEEGRERETACGSAQARSPGGGRVLIVEDDAAVGAFAEQALAQLGFETVLATGAADALERLEAGGDAFNIMFSDVVMPGMDGVRFAAKVRARWPGLPIVLTSGYSHVLAQEGSHGFPLLPKPYSMEALADILHRELAGAATPSMGRGAI
jgi:signal transduction histidine kinase